MINLLILGAGSDHSAQGDGQYPALLSEFRGELLVEKLVQRLSALKGARSIWALRKDEVKRYHIDNVLLQLDPAARLVQVEHDTRGAACTALLAAGSLDNDQPLLIINATDHIEANLAPIIEGFSERRLDAGVIVFPSVHPRYSFVRVDEQGLVVEAAEKRPISRLATAGHYWFARGRDFIEAAKRSIRKDAHVNNLFYVCPVFNEMILAQARIGVHAIEAKQYYPLKTLQQLQRYEHHLDEGSAA